MVILQTILSFEIIYKSFQNSKITIIRWRLLERMGKGNIKHILQTTYETHMSLSRLFIIDLAPKLVDKLKKN